jgi:hypothetical protein
LTATTARIHAVVVHHRGRDLLGRCLDSLLASHGVDLWVAVVANACPEALPTVAESDPRVVVLRSETPLGFAAANNRGAALLREHLGAPDHVYFLNNDTVSEPDALAGLAAHLEATPRCGVAGPRLMIAGEPGRVNSLGLNVATTGEAWDEGIGTALDDLGPLPARRSVIAATGTALLVRREAYDAIVGWDEIFHFYYEDVDLCLRARAAEWEVEVVTASVVCHALSATAGRGSDLKLYHTYRNRLLLLALHWPAGLLLRVAPRLLATELWRFLVRLTSGSPREAWLQLRAWGGFLRRLPRALRKRLAHGPARGFVPLLKPPRVPSIRLPPAGLRTGQERGGPG